MAVGVEEGRSQGASEKRSPLQTGKRLVLKRNRVLTSHGPALLVVRPLRADVHMPNM